MSFTDQDFVWSLYTKYVRRYITKNIKKKKDYLMTPGLFCEYFAIELHQKIKGGNLKNGSELYEEIIEEFVARKSIFCNNPCGPVGCNDIYKDDDGDMMEMIRWK